MNLLALDIGTTTGFAFSIRRNDGRSFEASGTWLLATPRELRAQKKVGGDRTRDLRFDRLKDNIDRLLNSGLDFDYVLFEDVKFSTSTAQTQLWSSLRAAIWAATLQQKRVKTEVLHTAGLKKYATGNGHAKKEDIEQVFILQFPGRPSADDNERDAVYLLKWGQEILCRKTT